MTRDDMLTEHLNMIYVLNELDLVKAKSKSKEIVAAASSGNILKMYKVLKNIPAANTSQLYSVAKKKFPGELKKSELHIEKEGKKLPSSIKDITILARAALLKINAETKDPEIKSKTQASLQKLDDILKNIQRKGMVGKGISMVFTATLVAFFVGNALYVAPLLSTTGVIFIASSFFVYLVREILSLFIMAKQNGQKAIM